MSNQQVAVAGQAPVATAGNFRPLRDFFFKFRTLVANKHIAWEMIKEDDKTFINAEIVRNATWNAAQAHKLHQLLLRFAQPLRKWGLDVYALAPPQMPTAPRPSPAAGGIIRRAAVTLCDACLLVFLPPESLLHRQVSDGFKGRTYDPQKKEWRVPFLHSTALAKWAQENDVLVGDSAARFMEAYGMNLEQSTAAQRVELSIPLKRRLFDFQTVGVDYALRVLRGLIADQMGLGKTPQGIATAVARNTWPILVICPKSLRGNWRNEIHAWSHHRAQIGTEKVMNNLGKLMASGVCDFLIVNYEAVEKYFVDHILPPQGGTEPRGAHVQLNPIFKLFKGVIIDEAHECRNPKIRRYWAIHALLRQYDFRLLLTGTPFVNTVHDLAALIDLLGHMEAFGGHKEFAKKYGAITADAFQANSANSVVLRELNTKLRTICMVRREKHQVLKELPDKFRTIVPLELSNRREYDEAFHDFQGYLVSNGASAEQLARSQHAEMLAQLQALKRLSVAGKMSQAREYIGNLLSQGEKVIVFVWHKETIAMLRQTWPALLEISGDVSDDAVEANKALFQSEDPAQNLIVITYKRGGVGHTLTASSNVVFLELGWNPKDTDQAEDRAHRIGQLSTVYCHYLLGKDTVDEWIYELIDRKRAVHVESTGSTEHIKTQSVEADLLNRIRQGGGSTRKVVSAGDVQKILHP